MIKKSDALYTAMEEIHWEITQINIYLSETEVVC